jgi:MurNAc alpha-1-phosphate uridylyltransferase
MAIFSHALFDQCREERFPLAPLLWEHIANNQVTGEIYEGLWFDIGTRERLDSLNLLLR